LQKRKENHSAKGWLLLSYNRCRIRGIQAIESESSLLLRGERGVRRFLSC